MVRYWWAGSLLATWIVGAEFYWRFALDHQTAVESLMELRNAVTVFILPMAGIGAGLLLPLYLASFGRRVVGLPLGTEEADFTGHDHEHLAIQDLREDAILLVAVGGTTLCWVGAFASYGHILQIVFWLGFAAMFAFFGAVRETAESADILRRLRDERELMGLERLLLDLAQDAGPPGAAGNRSSVLREALSITAFACAGLLAYGLIIVSQGVGDMALVPIPLVVVGSTIGRYYHSRDATMARAARGLGQVGWSLRPRYLILDLSLAVLTFTVSAIALWSLWSAMGLTLITIAVSCGMTRMLPRFSSVYVRILTARVTKRISELRQTTTPAAPAPTPKHAATPHSPPSADNTSMLPPASVRFAPSPE